jgi:hypothetical protein
VTAAVTLRNVVKGGIQACQGFQGYVGDDLNVNETLLPLIFMERLGGKAEAGL